MSKMYEALLRAEKERRARDERSDGAVAVVSATEPAPSPAASPDDRSAIANPAVPQPEQALSASSAGDVPYQEAVWQPSEKVLLAMQPRGRIVEQIRGLRSRINEIRAVEPPLKTLLVSSGLPEEGKSFVTANLAVSLASYRNTRVLLIDGDMRRGTLHQLIGTHNRPGLSDYLMNHATVAEIVQRQKHVDDSLAHSLLQLSFIPCGEHPDNAADLSGNGRFERLLSEVKDFFDWVIVDSSPVNLVADGVNMGRACDGVLLVTRGGVTKYQTAQRAMHELKASRIIGAVMNASQDLPITAGYYGYDKK